MTGQCNRPESRLETIRDPLSIFSEQIDQPFFRFFSTRSPTSKLFEKFSGYVLGVRRTSSVTARKKGSVPFER
jgi:hypothetical protein